jgi:phosphomannomutase
MITQQELDSVIKAYDVRGLVDQQITPEFVFTLGAATARFLASEGEPDSIVIGEDMRPSSDSLATAFAEGVMSQGMNAIRIGLASTDMLYFAAGSLDLPGAMFTASHNPAAYNGVKLCKSGARPIGAESGLKYIKDVMSSEIPMAIKPPGKSSQREMLTFYWEFFRIMSFRLVDDSKLWWTLEMAWQATQLRQLWTDLMSSWYRCISNWTVIFRTMRPIQLTLAISLTYAPA